jgi:ribosomal protein L34E
MLFFDNTQTHRKRHSKETVSCRECGSDSHPTALHRDEEQASVSSGNPYSLRSYGGEKTAIAPDPSVNSACTQICKDKFCGKPCAKTVLVRVFRKDHPEIHLKTYAIIDDLSKSSLASPEFFLLF